MTGEAYALLTLLCWTLGVHSFSKASELFSPALVNKFKLLLAVIFLGILALTIGHVQLSNLLNIHPKQWLWLGLSGVVGLAIGDFFGFTAFALIGPGRTSMFTVLAPVAAFLLGMPLLGEDLNAIGIIGMTISLAGIYLLISNKASQGKLQQREGKNYAFGLFAAAMAALSQGVGLVFSKIGMDSIYPKIHPIQITFIRMLVAFLAIFLMDIFRQKNTIFIRPFLHRLKDSRFVLMGTIFGPVLGVSFSIAAIGLIKVSVAQTIFALLPITILLFSYFFSKERIRPVLWVYTAISLAGVIILLWRDGA